jgi:hypothetical protein
MTTIFIKDTGFIEPGTETGTVETRVNNGTEIPIKVTNITWSRNNNTENSPVPQNYTLSDLSNVQVGVNSLTAPIITINGTIDPEGVLTESTNVIKEISGVTSVLDKDGASTSNEVDIVYLLDQLCCTKGYKEIYYKDTVTNNLWLYAMGKTDIYNSTYRHIHIICKSFTIPQDAKTRLIRWTMTCEVMKGE